MNRRKKITQIAKKRLKQANAKLNTKKKPVYISKAERAKRAEEQNIEQNEQVPSTEQTSTELTS